MYSVDARGCNYVRNYEEAARVFHTTRTSGRRSWMPNERPLDNSRKHHLRITHDGLAKTYSLYLYSTAMVCYHAPTPEGRRVDYNWYASLSGKSFMWHVAGIHDVLHVTTTQHEGVRQVRLPHMHPVSLWYVDAAQRHVDPSRSSVPQLYRRVVTPELRAWRSSIYERLAAPLDLCEYLAAEFVEEEWDTVCAKSGYAADNVGSIQSLNTLFLRDDTFDSIRELYRAALHNQVRLYYRRCSNSNDSAPWSAPKAADLMAAARRSVLSSAVSKGYFVSHTPQPDAPKHRRYPIPAFPEKAPKKYFLTP